MKYLILVFVSIGFFQTAFSQTELPESGICAHRGAMDTHPENTTPAFEEAVRLGVQMIELDVRLTKDKKLVILHDETVDRTTDGTGKIEDLTWKQVKKLDAGNWKSPEFANVRIPTFSEALAVIPDNIWINVHLKGDEELGMLVAEAILKQDKQHQAFVACEKKAAIGVRKISDAVMICNMDRQDKTEEYVAQTIAGGSEFIQLYKVPIDEDMIDYTKTLKENNVKVNYCCTDNPEDINKLFEYGVDFVLVNESGKVLKALE